MTILLQGGAERMRVRPWSDIEGAPVRAPGGRAGLVLAGPAPFRARPLAARAARHPGCRIARRRGGTMGGTMGGTIAGTTAVPREAA